LTTVLTGPNVILTLKVAVVAVTVLLIASLIALATGHRRLHGRINIVFFALTMFAVLGLEVIIRLVDPDLFKYLLTDPVFSERMRVHLAFSIPSAVLMPILLFSGIRRYKWAHIPLASVFAVFWAGTFVTGVFFLPHSAVAPPAS
jgi:hypothetical protein